METAVWPKLLQLTLKGSLQRWGPSLGTTQAVAVFKLWRIKLVMKWQQGSRSAFSFE